MSLRIYHNQSVYTGGLNSPVLTADVVLASEAVARIAELEGALALAYFGIRELRSQFEFCDCSEDPQDDICMNCILGSIMRDIETQKALEVGSEQ